MTKFNPENKKQLTYAESLGPAMRITDPKDAAQYLKAYISFIEDHKTTGMEVDAEEIAKSNLAYWAGYGDNEQRERVETLFNCAHPMFGSIKEKGAPSFTEAFEMGKALGEKIKKEKA